jgi:hypothetical protein
VLDSEIVRDSGGGSLTKIFRLSGVADKGSRNNGGR